LNMVSTTPRCWNYILTLTLSISRRYTYVYAVALIASL
jgi:hypothetical protein